MHRSYNGIRTLVFTVFAALCILLVIIIIFGLLTDSASQTDNVGKKPLVPVPTYTNTPEPTPTRTPRPTLTPDVIAIYKSQLRPWFEDTADWSDDLAHEFGAPSADHDAALAALEHRALELLQNLLYIHPPPQHTETHRLIAESMQACVDAVRYARDGDMSLSNIYGGTCEIGFTLMLDVIGRD